MSKSNEHFFRQSIVRQSVPFVASFCQVSEQEVEANFSLVGGSTKNWASLGVDTLSPSLSLLKAVCNNGLCGVGQRGNINMPHSLAHLTAEVFFKLDMQNKEGAKEADMNNEYICRHTQAP